MKSAQTNIKRPGGLLGCVLSTHTVSRVCLSRVFVGYWRDGAAANGKNAYSYLAVMRLNCLKYLDRSFGSVDTSQGSIKFSDSRRSRALSWQPSPTVKDYFRQRTIETWPLALRRQCPWLGAGGPGRL